ncbi:MAG: hypothetical protein ABL952_03670 [Pyrinomonadaceae bacterium]
MEQTLTYLRDNFWRYGRTEPITAVQIPAVESAALAQPNSISIETRPIVTFLAVMMSLLLLASTAVLIADGLTGYNVKMIGRMSKLLSVDQELNAPAFFSTLILLFSSGLLAAITYLKRQERSKYVWHWALLAFGFLFMAFDEMASFHERLIEPMRALLGEKDLGIFYFAWVVPAIGLVLFLGFIFLKFWWELPPKTRLLVFVAAALYLSGAIGVELIDGKFAEIAGKNNLTYTLLTSMEEVLEMAGVIVFIKALLDYIGDSFGKLDLRLGVKSERPAEYAENSQLQWIHKSQ